MKIAIDYLLVFSHFWFATPQLVLQADWQEVWHSPQPPFLALSHRLRVSRVLILSIICISDLLNSNGFPGGPPADSHLKIGKILAYHLYKVKMFQQFGYLGSSVYGGNLRGFSTRDSITRRHSPFHCFRPVFPVRGSRRGLTGALRREKQIGSRWRTSTAAKRRSTLALVQTLSEKQVIKTVPLTESKGAAQARWMTPPRSNGALSVMNHPIAKADTAQREPPSMPTIAAHSPALQRNTPRF